MIPPSLVYGRPLVIVENQPARETWFRQWGDRNGAKHFHGYAYSVLAETRHDEPVEVPKNAPPMFNVIASDDFLFRGQVGVVESWFKAGRPVEFHLYLNGGLGIRTAPAIAGSMHYALAGGNGFLAVKPKK